MRRGDLGRPKIQRLGKFTLSNEQKGNKMEIGKKISELRKMAKLTQVEFAERVGVGLRFIRDLEQGKSTVRLDKVNQVLEFLGYHLEVIRNEKE
jgi:y4mF family transcriptional regulator